jgi:hypothetical protein
VDSKIAQSFIKSKETLYDQLPEIDFTNILHAAFKRADPKSANKNSQAISIFALLGSANVKFCIKFGVIDSCYTNLHYAIFEINKNSSLEAG